MPRPSSKIGSKTGDGRSVGRRRRVDLSALPGRRVGPGAGPGRRIGPNMTPGTPRKIGRSGGEFDGGKRGKPASGPPRPKPGQGPGGRPGQLPVTNPAIGMKSVTQRSVPQGGKDSAGAKSRLARRMGR
jgi:hypothetical protein